MTDPVQVLPTPHFRAEFKQLRKRYRSIERDLKALIDVLEKGETPGDAVQGFERRVYKVRLQNSDAQRGKSGGYRIIYYVRTETLVLLMSIYTKSDQEDIPAGKIRAMLIAAEQELEDEAASDDSPDDEPADPE